MRRALPLLLLASTVVTPVALAAPASATSLPSVVSVAGGGVNDGLDASNAALRAYAADYGPDGTLYIADASHNRITTRATDGTYATFAGTGDLTDGVGGFGGDGGQAAAAQLRSPERVRTTPAGDVIISDTGNHRVRFVDHTTGVITTIAGNGATGTAVASSDATSQPLDPADAVFDPATGDVVIADRAGARVWARHSDGSLSLVAGSGTTYPGDGPATSARLLSPASLAFLPNGDLLIADYQASSGTVRQLHAGSLTTVAGLGDGSSADGSDPVHAQLPQLQTLAVRDDGTVFAGTVNGIRTFTVGGTLGSVATPQYGRVATFDSTSHLIVATGVILRRETDGTYTRIVGSDTAAAYDEAPADGIAAASGALAPDGAPLVVGTDTYLPSRRTLDRLGADGELHRVAGTGAYSYGIPDGTAATSQPLAQVMGVAPAPDGGLFVNDAFRIALLKSDGTLSSYTGSAPVLSGVTEGEDAAKLPSVQAMVSAPNGDLYFGAGPMVGVIRWSDHTVHVIHKDVQQLVDTGIPPSSPETITALGRKADGTLLVLSERSSDWNFPAKAGLVRQLDPSTGAQTLVYFASQLTGLAVASDGSAYVGSPVFGHGTALMKLATDGSLTRVAGAGHTTSATQSGDDLYLPDVAGLGMAADGGVLIASATARRVLELQPGFSVTPLPSVTNVAASYSGPTYGETVTLSWTVPAGLPDGSFLAVSKQHNRRQDPDERLNTYNNLGSTWNAGYTDAGDLWNYRVYVVGPLGDQSAPALLRTVATGDTTPPAAPSTQEGYSPDGTLALKLPLGGDIDHDVIRIAQGTTAPASSVVPSYTGSDTVVTLTGLVVGQPYTGTITAYDWSGNVSAPWTFHFTAGSEPHAVLQAGGVGEGAYVGPNNLFFYPAHDSSFSGTSLVCSLDGAPFDCNAGGGVPTLNGLAAGPHTAAFHLVNSLGAGPDVVRHFIVDTTPPTVAMGALAPFTLASSAVFTWKGTDNSGTVASYNYRWQRAASTGGFGAFTTPKPLSINRSTLTLAAGYTYCMQVQAKDRAGNTGPWSASRCTTRPLDDRGLTASSGWQRLTASGFFGNTYSQTKTVRAQLSKTASFRQLAIVATTCSTCGSIAVYSGTTLVKTISLVSSTTRHQVLFVLPVMTARTAAVTVRVTSSNKTVQIDGVGFARG